MVNGKIVNDDRYIKLVLRNIAVNDCISVSVYINADDICKGEMNYKRKQNEMLIFMQKDLNCFIIGQKVTVSFLNKETIFHFHTRVVKITEDGIKVNPPEVLFSSFKRNVTRYKVSEQENVRVKFYKGSKYFYVKDINTKGLSFTSDTKIFKVGQKLWNVFVNVNDCFNVYVDGVIKYCRLDEEQNYILGLNFHNVNWATNYELFNYINKRNYPLIKDMNEFSTDKIHDLYEKSNYLSLKPGDELEKSFLILIDNLKKLKDYPQIMSNPAYVKDDTILTGASVLRIYNRTFIAQHLAAIPEARLVPQSKSELYLEINDYLINHPYFDYYLAYFINDLKWHGRMYNSIGSNINDENKFLYDTLYYFECNIDECNDEGDFDNGLICNVVDDPNEFIEYCKNNLKPIITNCYGYDKDSFYLEEIRQIYEIIGLYIDRRLWEITKDGRTVSFIVGEAYTNGLNLYNLLDACSVYVVDKKIKVEEIFKSIINDLVIFYRKYNKSEFNILLNDMNNINAEEINVKGVHYSHYLGRVIANKLGGIEYKNLLLNNTR